MGILGNAASMQQGIKNYKESIYKKDSKGKIRITEISADNGVVTQSSGILDGKMVTHTYEAKPKNVGKINETTVTKQAVLEAKSKITKKLDEGYFKTIDEAINEEVILPMLAKSYEKEFKKIDWGNAYVQPKLDGMRCLKKGSKLISRKGKSIDTLPHLNKELLFIDDWLDGEIYAHGLSFQENMKIIKKNRPESINVKYHVYDLVLPNLAFRERYILLKEFTKLSSHIELVPTYKISNEEELKEYHLKFISEGYEGSILRWGDEGYKIDGRSSHLLKYKDFIDKTYTVVDVEPSDKNPNQGIVICEGFRPSEDGDSLGERFTFGCGMKMSHKDREEILINKKDYIGKTAEIRFFEFSDDGIPRFPVCVGFRLDK